MEEGVCVDLSKGGVKLCWMGGFIEKTKGSLFWCRVQGVFPALQHVKYVCGLLQII